MMLCFLLWEARNASHFLPWEARNASHSEGFVSEKAYSHFRKTMLRVAGFEPATTCTQNRYATKLRYTLATYSGGLEPPTFSLEG